MADPTPLASDEYTLDKILLEITTLHWKQALGLFSQLSFEDATAKQFKRLAINMMAAQKHRAILYNQLARCIEQGQLNLDYKPAPCDNGSCETVAHEENGETVLDHPHGNPAAWAKRKVDELKPMLNDDKGMALVGIRDGYLLTALAKTKSPFDDGRAVPVFVIEPDAERLLACFQIHDWSSNNGPLAHPAFDWIAGSDWAFELRNRLQQDPMLPVPEHTVSLLPDAEKTLLGISREVAAKRLAQSKENYLEFCERKRLFSKRATAKALLEPAKQKKIPPRVAVIGSRFNPESARLAPEIARTFAGMGWRASLTMESSERQRLTLAQIHSRIGTQDPNLVVAVHQPLLADPGSVDANTPTLRWSAIPPEATGQEPFVRVATVNPLSREHLDIGDRALVSPGIMLPLVEPAPALPEQPVVTLFASIPSQPVKQLREAVADSMSGSPVAAIVERAGQALMDHYEKGHSLSTPGQMDFLVSRCASGSSSSGHRDQAARRLWPLNETLYILQTAQWAAMACKNTGAELRLVGDHWDAYPQLAAHHQKRDKTRGERVATIQSSTLCLHARPGFCLDEQTMQLTADGACVLMREHPFNGALPELAGFLAKHAPNAKNAAEAASGLSPGLAEEFKKVYEAMQKALPQHDAPDPVTLVRSCARGGILDPNMSPMPQVDKTRFGNPAQLAAQITHWHKHPELRLKLIRERQASLYGRLGTEPALLRAIYLLARRFLVNA